MMKYVVLVLALIAVASAQYLYGAGVSGPRFHNAFASSADSGIRRFGPTGAVYAAPAAYGGLYY